MTTSTAPFPSFAVIGADGVYLSTGGRMALPEFQQLGYWLDAAQRRNIDTLWLHNSAGWTWQDSDIDACDPWIVAGGAHAESGEPWWTATRPGVYGVRDIVQPRYEDRAPWREAPDAESLRHALLAFRATVGIDWRRSPGATGLKLLRQAHTGAHATRLELDGEPPAPALDGVVCDAGHLNWTRPLERAETARAHELYLHSFDVNGQYLAACASLVLGVGQYQHHTRTVLPDKPTQWPAGYFRVRLAEKAKNGPCPSIVSNDTAHWITTPTLRLLREQGATIHIIESYTWARTKRYLEPWYKVLRTAREQLSAGPHADPIAREAVKGLYRHGIGWFESRKWDRSDDTLYRPDWAHQARALARANVLRTVYRVLANYGASPVAVGSDCVYYLSESPNPLAAPWIGDADGDGLRVSSQLGHYKVKDAGVPLAEVLPYLKGQRWSLIPLQQALNLRAGRKVAA